MSPNILLIISGDMGYSDIGSYGEEIETRKLERMRRTVRSAVPGILFLSRGQSEIEATERLNAICHTKDAP